MAYQIDFTASVWAKRRLRKAIILLLVLAVVAGVAWGAYYVYKTYNQPTLSMKLAEYESVAHPIEDVDSAWDVALKEYNAMAHYYRLVWAANPTNFLAAIAARNAPHIGRGSHPKSWTLKTGGECSLEYVYVFDSGDKASQVDGLESKIANAVTSIVAVVGGKVDVKGVQHENLLNVDELNITVRFSLPDVKSFPVKERVLSDCAHEISAMRKKVQEFKMEGSGDAKSAQTTPKKIMVDYLPKQFDKDKATGKHNPDFPDIAPVIDVSGWFDRADKFIAKNNVPVDKAESQRLKNIWDKVGDARFPWDRVRELDNDVLVDRTKALTEVSDGVRQFKGFLEQRRADCRKKVEPFIDAYDRNDVFNKPLIEVDLKDRVARSAGVSSAVTSFRDETGTEPVVLEKKDETFYFTWVRWTLSLGKGEKKDADHQPADSESSLTVEKLADCARRAQELGPGYVLDKVSVNFSRDGSVEGAILEGLMPVKKVEQRKEATGNVD